jgi:hypothetical protein
VSSTAREGEELHAAGKQAEKIRLIARHSAFWQCRGRSDELGDVRLTAHCRLSAR